MNETTKNSGEKLSVTPSKTLTLKRGSVEQGVVRQSFSHGRTKAVVVEKVKRRGSGPGETKPAEPAPGTAKPAPTVRRSQRKAAPAAPTPGAGTTGKPSGVVLPTLTEEERVARAQALGNAKLREA